MRHASRPLFTILSASSLMLCVATGALWVRSEYVADLVGRFGRPSVFVRSVDGLLFPHWTTSDLGERPGWRHGTGKPDPARSAWAWLGRDRWAQLGFMHAVGQTNDNQPIHQLAVPYYAVFIATTILPLIWLVRRMRRRARPGYCPVCGYDLRASPDRCPECGAATTQPAR